MKNRVSQYWNDEATMICIVLPRRKDDAENMDFLKKSLDPGNVIEHWWMKKTWLDLDEKIINNMIHDAYEKDILPFE